MRTLDQIKALVSNAGSYSDQSYERAAIDDIQQALLDLIEYLKSRETDGK